MHRLRNGLTTCLTLTMVAWAASATAQGITVSDPSGDIGLSGLDITSAAFHNRDSSIVATLTFVADAADTVIVAVGTRDGHLVRVVSEHPSHGADNTFLIGRSGRTLPCDDLSSAWNRDAAQLVLEMPSDCLHGGNYGAVRAWVLTEESSSGQDVDFAPENARGEIRFTQGLPRG